MASYEEVKTRNSEIFSKLRLMFSMFKDIVDYTPIDENKNAEDITYYVYKISTYERQFSWKNADNNVRQKYMKKGVEAAEWMLFALKDLFYYNRKDPSMIRKIKELYSFDEQTFGRYMRKYPCLESGTSSSSDSEVDEDDLEDGEIK